MKLDRIWHPWHKWEEVSHNMWGTVPDRRKAIKEAERFTGDHVIYGEYMRKVTREWKFSCENALTDYNLNRRAWIGHAAVALAISIPEDITRAAWARLSNEQQYLANKEASEAIQTWENMHRKSRKLHKDLGGQMLLWRDS